MAIHLTPTELAREAGLERREVIEKCMEMGVPIFQGRIDKTLFLANLSRAGRDGHRRRPPRRYRPDASNGAPGERAPYTIDLLWEREEEPWRAAPRCPSTQRRRAPPRSPT